MAELASQTIARGVWPQGATVTIEVSDVKGVRRGPTHGKDRARHARHAGARAAGGPGALAGAHARHRRAGRAAGRSSRGHVRRVEVRRHRGGVSRHARAGVAAASGSRIAVPAHRARPRRMADPDRAPTAARRGCIGRNGQPLAVPVAFSERETNGQRAIAADLNLAPLSAGDYVIELTVGSGDVTENANSSRYGWCNDDRKTTRARSGRGRRGGRGRPRRPAGAAAAAAAAASPVFRGGTTLVQVDAYPTKDGKIVEGLTKADFEVLRGRQGPGSRRSRVRPHRAEHARCASPRSEHAGRGERPRGRSAQSRLRDLPRLLPHEPRRVALDPSVRSSIFSTGCSTANDLFGVMTPNLRPRDLMLGRQTQTLEEQLTRYWYGGNGCPVEQRKRRCGEVLSHRHSDDALADGPRAVEPGRAGRLSRRSARGTESGRAADARLDTAGGQGRSSRTRRRAIPGSRQVASIRAAASRRIRIRPRAVRRGKTWCSTERYRLLSMDFQQRLRDFIQSSNRNNVTFYPINPAGPRDA